MLAFPCSRCGTIIYLLGLEPTWFLGFVNSEPRFTSVTIDNVLNPSHSDCRYSC